MGCWRSAILGSLLLLTACTTRSPGPSASPSSGEPAAISGSAGPTGPTAPAAAAQRVIEMFNQTAGGPVAAQQRVLDRLVSAGQRPVQGRCPAATTTIAFVPVYDRLSVAAGWKPSSGTLPGTVYALPTLIRIYRGDRIVGTDLTDLHLSIDGGVARLPALCLT